MKWGYRDLQTFFGSVCGDQFVTLRYLVCTVLEVGFRGVPSESQGVLAVVAALSTGPTFLITTLSTTWDSILG